tara:strand:+ start:2407 stop:2841 length:435 start_codon:yes stop_codon:yes gene_type:complete
MLKYLLSLLIILSISNSFSQNFKEKDSLAIINVLETQRVAWNNNDIDDFMQGYLKSDKLVFSGSNGPVYGWNLVKDRYNRTYSSKELMGFLKFDINNLFLITRKVAILLGKFHLDRKNEKLSGYFTLIFKKINGNWYIVSDHTS